MKRQITALFCGFVSLFGWIHFAAAQSSPSQHWAYVAPKKSPLPTVKRKSWIRNPIDNFILARLEKEGLQPSPEASKEILLRRVYLDLIGLTPSVKEVDEFLAENSPHAYEKIVDKLLASKHYGERWARPWLDLARYADSDGFVQDARRSMWMYRDWVINALNDDMPFDQFTIEQIAGDMLPNPTLAQKIATGFHRNTMLNQEGGIDLEEARWETLVDRVNTTSTVWLGSTLGCAQCHNHKYDPFSQKDYYRFMAFFDNSEYSVSFRAYFDKNILEPQLDLPAPEQAKKQKELNDEIAKIELQLKTQTPELNAAQAQWEASVIAAKNDWTVLNPTEFQTTNGATLTKENDDSLLASGANPVEEIYVITAPVNVTNITALRLELLPDARLPQGGPGRNLYGNCQLSGIEISANAQSIKLSNAAVDGSSGRFDAPRFLSGEVPWVIDATRDAERFSRQTVFVFAQPITANELTIKLNQVGKIFGASLGKFRLSVTTSIEPLRITSIPARLRATLEMPAMQRSEKQQQELSAEYRSLAPNLDPVRARLIILKNSLTQLGIQSAHILQEKNNFMRPATLFRERGSFLSPGEKVFAATPAALPAMPENAAYNRLGLARWLIAENNPLTARVAVNRFWEQIFGRGIVETSEDFGNQSSPPSHPELLDWLAVEFVNADFGMRIADSKSTSANDNPKSATQIPQWKIKPLLKTIVTSATYRQSSSIIPNSELRNPQSNDSDNRLLARAPRFRMEAEMVRDTMLSISGLLSNKIGGMSVYPPQPETIWSNIYIPEKWKASEGEDRYRRSLYTFMKRTAPFPMFTAFDATTRETCTVRRVRTNTPLQALTMLNDDGAFEFARGLAKRILSEAVSKDSKARATYGFRLCRARFPNEAELTRLVNYFDEQQKYFANHPEAVEKITRAKSPYAEFAAWTMVANVLLNMDGTMTKD